MKKRILLQLILPCLLFLFQSCNDAKYRITILPSAEEKRMDIMVGDHLFTSLIYSDKFEKAILYPINAPSGTPVTRGWPLNPRRGERIDHLHHVGMWFNYGDVNGIDFWNNNANVPPERKNMFGIIATRSAEIRESNGPEIFTRADWLAPDSTSGWVTLVEEESIYKFYASAKTRTIDRTILLRAKEKELLWKDDKEGIYGLRVAREFELPSAEPLIFTDSNGNPSKEKVVDTTSTLGKYESSEGIKGEAVWGTRGTWVKLSSVQNGKPVTLVIFDHPENPGHPAYWMARPYGLFAVNNLGMAVYSNGKEAMNMKMKPGEEEIFRYRFSIYEGQDPDPITLNNDFRKYSEE